MRRLRRDVVLLIIWLLVSYIATTGRLGERLAEVATPFTLLFVTVGVICTLTVRFMLTIRNPLMVIASTALYLGAQLAAGPTIDLGTTRGLLVLLSQLVLLHGVLYLARMVSNDLRQFEDAVAFLSFQDTSGRIRPLEEAKDDIAAEITRGRRYERPVTLAIVAIDNQLLPVALHHFVREVQEMMVNRYMLAGLGRIITQKARRTDLIIQDTLNKRFILISPETQRQEVEPLFERLQESAQAKLGVTLDIGVAAFPEHAYTFDELVHSAEKNLTPPQEGSVLQILQPKTNTK